MNSNTYRILLGKEKLWEGCMLASIAHAIMVAHYPESSNENSWDCSNYSVQDSAGTRGTISFYKDYYVATFRNDNSERLNKENRINGYEIYFNGAPEHIIKLANEEALQYLFEEVNGKIGPLITTAFWGNNIESFSNDSIDEIRANGGFLLDIHLQDIEEAFDSWKEYYEMSEEQYNLLRNIYKRKVENPNKVLLMSKEEIAMIGSHDEQGLEESKISFKEIGIEWEY